MYQNGQDFGNPKARVSWPAHAWDGWLQQVIDECAVRKLDVTPESDVSEVAYDRSESFYEKHFSKICSWLK